MTAAIFCVFLIVGYAHFVTLGPVLYGDRTIYTVAFWATTLSAAVFCLKAKEFPYLRAAACIVVYAYIASGLYKSEYTIVREHAILFGALLDIAMAYVFIFHGGKRWEIYAGLCYVASVVVGVFTAAGIVPDHTERAPIFIAFSQPDLTALCGHAANIIIGLGAADGGLRAYHYLASRLVVADFSRGFGFVFLGHVEAREEKSP